MCSACTQVLNCSDDALFTLSEMQDADKTIRTVFDKMGAAEHYHCRFFAGGHRFDKDMQDVAFDFLRSNLWAD